MKYIFLFLLIITSGLGFAVPNRAYVANQGSSDVSVIDTTTNGVIATIMVDIAPINIAVTPDGKMVYVVSAAFGTIAIIDAETNTISSTIPGFDGSGNIAFTPDGKFAYISQQFSNTVVVLNTATQAMQTIPGITSPRGPAINPAGTRCYVLSGGSVIIIDIASNTVIAPSIPIMGTFAFDIAINSDGTRAYVPTNGPGGLTVLDLTMNTFLESIDIMNTSGRGVALTPNDQFAYVANESDDTVSIVDLTMNVLVGTPLVVTGTPTAIAMTPDGKFAYVTRDSGSAVSIIDTAMQTVIPPTIAVGMVPVSIAISPPLILPPPPPPSPPPSPPPPSPTIPLAPVDLTGVQQKGSDSGLELEYVNSLQWQANPNATGVVGYFVYRDGAKIATLNASTLRYEDHNRKRGVSLLYTVTSFNADGMESNSVSVTIK